MATLTNKTALITGASRGIGRATAKALARAGARVIVHYGRAAAEADALVNEIRASGGQADRATADLSLPDGVADLATQVRAIAGEQLDVLVSNAGISKAATIGDHTVEDFDRLFATNVRGPFFLIQQLLPILREGSNIIVISSAAARTAVGKPGVENPSILAYAAAKGAIETLVKYWAAILGPQGIRVNAVAPGVIDTDMSSFTKTEAGREAVLGMQALKRIGKPEELLREAGDELEANHLSITHPSPRVPLIEARALLPGCGRVSLPLPMDGSAFVASRDLSVASHM